MVQMGQQPHPLRPADSLRLVTRAMPRVGSWRRPVAIRLAAVAFACFAANPGVFCAAAASSSKSSDDGPFISGVAATPSLLAPGDPFVVTWTYTSLDTAEPATTGDLRAFDIDLEHCPNGPGTCQCNGALLTSLCPELQGCVDSDGSYDLVLPEDDDSTTGVAVGDVYQIRVSLASDPTVHACGYGFRVQEKEADDVEPFIEGRATSDGSTTEEGAEPTATLTAFAPNEKLVPGQAFTAQWVYDDGLEEAEGSGGAGDFAVDLYTCAGGACADGSCGTFVAGLCGEEGCYDPGIGDYDVVIPSSVAPGAFSLYVEKLMDAIIGPWDCAFFNVSVNSSSSAAPASQPTPAPEGQPTTAAPVATIAATTTTLAPTVPPPLSLPAREPGSPGMPPTPVPAKQACVSGVALTFSFEELDKDAEKRSMVTVAHESGDRADQGCVTMTDVWLWLKSAPEGVPTDLLFPVDPSTGSPITDAIAAADLTGVWLLRASLDVTNGVTLELKGAVANGDCNELKISSAPSKIHSVRGYGGNVDIYKTLIQSWDEDAGTPHILPVDSEGDEPRSYLGCISEIFHEADTCDGAAKKDKGECRMDMVDSELGYLGYYGTEAYGITWKVRGFCKDLSNVEIFDRVNVYGDITNCNIHHMWYGMYSYGHQAGVWTLNRIHDNHVYGFDPHDDSDYLTIHNNTVYNNAKHGIIASKRCDHVSVRYNKVDNSGGSGIMLHRSCDDSEVIGNEVHGSADAALALMETSRTIVRDNIFADGKWGSRLTLGATDNMISNNVFSNNYRREIYAYTGADEPYVSPFTGVNVNNTFDSNMINYTATAPVNLEDSDATVISNNIWLGGEGYFEFDNAHDTVIVGNTGAIIASEDHRVDGTSCFTAESPFEPTC